MHLGLIDRVRSVLTGTFGLCFFLRFDTLAFSCLLLLFDLLVDRHVEATKVPDVNVVEHGKRELGREASLPRMSR